MAGPASDSMSNVVSDKVVTPQHCQVSSTRPEDSKERKRNQNRIAQRYNQKQRLRALEEAVEQCLVNNSELAIPHEPPQHDEFWSFPYNDTVTTNSSFTPLSLPGSQIDIRNKFTQSDSVLPELPIPGTKQNGDQPALHRAICAGNELITRLLLERGADVGRQDSNGKTALHLAVESEDEPLVRILLGGKIDLNVKDSLGRTALFSAVQSDNENVVKLLLEASIDVNMRDSCGEVALHLAVDRGSLSLTSLLLSHGADIEA